MSSNDPFPCLPDILQIEGKSIKFQGGIEVTKIYIVFSAIHLMSSNESIQIKTRYSLYVHPTTDENVTKGSEWIPLRSRRSLSHSLTHEQYANLPSQDLSTLFQTMAPAFVNEETINESSDTVTSSTVTWITLKDTLFP